MKKLLLATFFVVTFFALGAVPASAVTNNIVKVGLRYDSTAMFSANLQNAVGEGYALGYYDENRSFVSLGRTDETTISMTAAGTIYMDSSGAYSSKVPAGGYRSMGSWHVQLEGYHSFEAAASAAASIGGWPAWIDRAYVVRVGCYSSRSEAESAGLGGRAVQSSSTGVIVTKTSTKDILFEFDCGGELALGVQPDGWGRDAVTWFRGYKYAGGFEYPRVTGGNLKVINVLELEDYVKGVVPYEMGGDWPLAALEAQAVCARTFVCGHVKHLSSQGFDVCAALDCQVYHGLGNSSTGPTDTSNQAVENTAGLCIYYQGTLVQDAVYHAFDGGATEDGANVWGTETGYLKGKIDPYEAQTSIPNYSYTVTYTAAELSWILDQKGYSIGTVTDAYVSEYTPVGNVSKVTFVGTGGTKTVSGETCRTIFYSSTYKKSVNSMRFDINGGGRGTVMAPSSTPPSAPVSGSVSGGVSLSGGGELSTLNGAEVISGSGETSVLQGDSAAAITASGIMTVGAASGSGPVLAASSLRNSSGNFVITGTGSGHNVGMSQYGAKAMAELGYDFRNILEFYYTNITIA